MYRITKPFGPTKNTRSPWVSKRPKNLIFFLQMPTADPKPTNGLEEMSAHFEEQKSIVLGYGGYIIETRSPLNKLIRFETLFTAIQYFSYASWGKPYMGVGRNLAYTSEEFFNQNGFATHLHIKAGDDDLFVNQAANKMNTAFVFLPIGITSSVPKADLKSWFHAKKKTCLHCNPL